MKLSGILSDTFHYIQCSFPDSRIYFELSVNKAIDEFITAFQIQANVYFAVFEYTGSVYKFPNAFILTIKCKTWVLEQPNLSYSGLWRHGIGAPFSVRNFSQILSACNLIFTINYEILNFLIKKDKRRLIGFMLSNKSHFERIKIIYHKNVF